MGDIGEVGGKPCFHFDRLSPSQPCPRCGEPAVEALPSKAAVLGVALTTAKPGEAVYVQGLAARGDALSTTRPINTLQLGAPIRVTAPYESGVRYGEPDDHTRMAISNAREISEGLVAVASRPTTITPNEEVVVPLEVAVPFYPPYRIGIGTVSETSSLRVCEMKLGQQLLRLDWDGQQSSEHLVKNGGKWPEALVPVHGPEWQVGMQLRVTLRNAAAFTDEVLITVWGHPRPIDRRGSIGLNHAQEPTVAWRGSPRDVVTDLAALMSRSELAELAQFASEQAQTGNALVLRRSDPVNGSSLQLRTSRPSELMRLREDGPYESAEYLTEVLQQQEKSRKAIADRLGVVLRTLEQQRAETTRYRDLYERARGDQHRAASGQEDSDKCLALAQLWWFGPTWFAELCRPANLHRTELPTQCQCYQCAKDIVVEQSGVVVPLGHGVSAYFHRDCFFVMVGAVEPAPGSQAEKGKIARLRNHLARLGHQYDRLATREHESRVPVDDDDAWHAWSSASDEEP